MSYQVEKIPDMVMWSGFSEEWELLSIHYPPNFLLQALRESAREFVGAFWVCAHWLSSIRITFLFILLQSSCICMLLRDGKGRCWFLQILPGGREFLFLVEVKNWKLIFGCVVLFCLWESNKIFSIIRNVQYKLSELNWGSIVWLPWSPLFANWFAKKFA